MMLFVKSISDALSSEGVVLSDRQRGTNGRMTGGTDPDGLLHSLKSLSSPSHGICERECTAIPSHSLRRHELSPVAAGMAEA
jgi:hypothetical protein